MSLDGGSVETEEIAHLHTAEDLRARAAELGADMNEGIEIDGINSFFRDIPPEISSSLFPHDFQEGHALPNASTSYASIPGLYSSAGISLAGKNQFLEMHPEEQFRPDPNASLTKPFESASNIASLVGESPRLEDNGPKAPGDV